MQRHFIADFKPGERIEDQVFLIKQKNLRTTSQGSLYIHVVLIDRTGQIPARMWQATEKVFQFMPQGGFMHFTGRCENYKGSLQFIIDGLREASGDEVDLGDFLPRTDRNIDEMWTRVQAILTTHIKHPDIKLLVDEFLADSTLMQKFRYAPAAIQFHHAVIGGLLEHTLSLLEVALKIVPMYPKLSMDLMLAGLFLHDIGKTAELDYKTSFSYSDQGQLIGHVVLACNWIDQKVSIIEQRTGKQFPRQTKWVMQHIVLSHHGQYEFGSPKLPALPEAVAVHYLDNLDAKINVFTREIENDKDPQSHWTQYNRGLETKLYKVDVTGVRGGIIKNEECKMQNAE